MYLWTNDEIEKILIQIDNQNLPFGKFSFVQKEGHLRLLGKGGFAYVYEAETRSGHKDKYAIKVIGFGDKHVDSELFRSSVQAQKDIGDFQDNIVHVYDYVELLVKIDEDNNVENLYKADENESVQKYLKLQFIVMEKIDTVLSHGKNGKVRLTPSSLADFDEQEILKLANNIGTALKLAHDKKVLHRDVKLENIFYSPKGKHYKLGDFGIAKVIDDGMASTITFTKGYGAPEVVGSLDDKYDNTADIYSFGMLLYVLLNGLRFPDSGGYDVNSKAQYSEGYILPDPQTCSEELYYIVAKMCMYNPNDRYQSIDEVLTDLEKLIYSENYSYKRTHKGAAFAIGSTFLLFGMALWKLSFIPSMVIHFPVAVYVMIALSIGQFILHILKKETIGIRVLNLGIGIYLIIKTGVVWWKAVLLFSVVFSLGQTSFIVASTCLVANITYLLQPSSEVLGAFYEYRWAAVSLLSLSFVLLNLYMLLYDSTNKYVAKLLRKDFFWIIIFLFYGSQVLYGFALQGDKASFYVNLWGWKMVELLRSMDLIKVGIIGMAFCAVWVIREKIMLKSEKIKRLYY